MITRIIVNAMGLGLVTYLLTGIRLDYVDTRDGVVKMLIIAAIFGVVNAVVKPLAQALTGCLVVLTFGLFLWVINAAMLLLTSWLASKFGLGWHVDGWLTALIASLILSVVSLLTHSATQEGRWLK